MFLQSNRKLKTIDQKMLRISNVSYMKSLHEIKKSQRSKERNNLPTEPMLKEGNRDNGGTFLIDQSFY